MSIPRSTTHELRGVVPVVPSPFDAGDRVDVAGFEAIVDRVVECGVDGIVALGSGGEVGYLSREERLQVASAAVRRASGKAFVIAGVAQYGTASAIAESARLAGVGVDALLVALPQYFATPLATVLKHYEAVCAAVEIPVLYYHFPFVFGLALEPKEFGTLFERVPLAGMKDSGLSTPALADKIRRIRRPVAAFTGLSLNLVDALAVGAVGTLCPLPTLLPKSALALVAASAANDRIRARRAQARLFRGLPIISGARVPRPIAEAALRLALQTGIALPQAPGLAHAGVKEALRALGVIDCAATRAPQLALDARQREKIASLASRVAEV